MTFDDIIYALKNDPRFVENDIDKEKFFSYVDMIDNKHEIKITKIEENDQQKVEENEDENAELEKDLKQISAKNLIHQSEGQYQQQQHASPVHKHVSEGQQKKVQPTSSSQNSTTVNVQVAKNDESLIYTAYNEVRDYKNSMNWILMKFDASTKKWIFFNKGSGGKEEMKSNISPDFIGYCYLRIENKNRGINRPFFILAKYVPSGTKIMTKANMSTRRGEIESILDYRNIYIEAETKDEISEEISKKLK